MALFTRLPPEESPGKASEPVPSTFATIVSYARGIAAPGLGVYELLKSRGICGVKIDKRPAQIQSAVNTVRPTQAIDPKTAPAFLTLVGKVLPLQLTGAGGRTLAQEIVNG